MSDYAALIRPTNLRIATDCAESSMSIHAPWREVVPPARAAEARVRPGRLPLQSESHVSYSIGISLNASVTSTPCERRMAFITK